MDPYGTKLDGAVENLVAVWGEVDVDLRLGGVGSGGETPPADRVLSGGGKQRVAGLDLGVGDLAVRLDGDEQDDLAADVHATSEFRVGGGDAGDDGTLGDCGKALRAQTASASGEKEGARSNEMRLPRKPPCYRGCIGGVGAGFSGG